MSARVMVIIGANGFLGRYLGRHFTRAGWEVAAVARRRDGWSGDGMFLQWDGASQGPWSHALEGAAAVINLAGSTLNCRPTPENRRQIMESRITATRVVGEAVRLCKTPPAVWLNASGADWYHYAKDEARDEWTGEPGAGFVCEVARAWEEEFFAQPAPGETRKVALRLGMVLANEPATAFTMLLRLARWGLGGRAGDGRQRVSWIHIGDLLRAVELLVERPQIDGPVNLTAPEQPENRDFMRAIRRAAGMPVGLPAPAWAVRVGAALMNTNPDLALASRRVRPRRLREEGFGWHWPDIAPAVADLAKRPGLEGFFPNPACRSMGARAWVPSHSGP